MSADMVIRFFENYGLIMTLLATSGIVFVGALKAIGLFSKLNPNAKKYVYFITSCVVSILSCTFYLCVIDAFVWADWGMTIACVIAFTISIYGVYENTGIRTFLKKILFTPIKNLLKRIPSALMSKKLTEEKVLELAKGLGSDILVQLANEIRMTETENDAAQSAASDIVEKEEARHSVSESSEEQKKTVPVDKFIKNNFFS